MTKKDYIKFAALLKDLRTDLSNTDDRTINPGGMLDRVESDMVRIFKQDNPNFDEDRFFRASQPSL